MIIQNIRIHHGEDVDGSPEVQFVSIHESCNFVLVQEVAIRTDPENSNSYQSPKAYFVSMQYPSFRNDQHTVIRIDRIIDLQFQNSYRSRHIDTNAIGIHRHECHRLLVDMKNLSSTEMKRFLCSIRSFVVPRSMSFLPSSQIETNVPLRIPPYSVPKQLTHHCSFSTLFRPNSGINNNGIGDGFGRASIKIRVLSFSTGMH